MSAMCSNCCGQGIACFAPPLSVASARHNLHFQRLDSTRSVCAISTRQNVVCCSISPLNRRQFVLSLIASAATGALLLAQNAHAANDGVEATAPQGGFMSPSGLRYFDFVIGEGGKPKWGDMVKVNFAIYTISPDGSSLRMAESTFKKNNFLYMHHGNGRMCLGFEEALHSMRVGGRRRAIVPKGLGYVNPGLGPIPALTRRRRKFFDELQENGGTVVFDIELASIEEGDGDPMGYYSDATPSPEELDELLTKVQAKNRANGTPQFQWDETDYFPDGATYFGPKKEENPFKGLL